MNGRLMGRYKRIPQNGNPGETVEALLQQHYPDTLGQYIAECVIFDLVKLDLLDKKALFRKGKKKKKS